MNNQKIVELIDQHHLSEAWIHLQEKIETQPKIEDLLLAGRIKMMQQNYGDSMNFYGAVLQQDSQNVEAKARIISIKSILNISNSFYYENTYLDDGLYE